MRVELNIILAKNYSDSVIFVWLFSTSYLSREVLRLLEDLLENPILSNVLNNMAWVASIDSKSREKVSIPPNLLGQYFWKDTHLGILWYLCTARWRLEEEAFSHAVGWMLPSLGDIIYIKKSECTPGPNIWWEDLA